MLRVTVRVQGAATVVLGSGDRLVFGRAPEDAAGAGEPAAGMTVLTIPRCAAHVSRLVGELTVGEELVRLRFAGGGEAQLSSLFDAPGGARRATLAAGMSALLDEGENQLLLLRGRALGETPEQGYGDLMLVVDVTAPALEAAAPQAESPLLLNLPDGLDEGATAGAPSLVADSREWFVALALAEPWLTGSDDYPRPPSNREVYERVRTWRGYAWNLERAQRVDEAIRAIAGVAFGPAEDPFRPQEGRRVSNVRFAVGRRIAETRLVTAADLQRVERAAGERARAAAAKAEVSTAPGLPGRPPAT